MNCLLGLSVVSLLFPIGVSLELNGIFVPNFGLLEHNETGTDATGSVGSNLVCRTDNTSCCRGGDNPNGGGFGGWFYPSGNMAVFNGIYQPNGQLYRILRVTQGVQFRRDGSASITTTANGIYRCEVADQNGVTQTRYVGLYSVGAGDCGFVKHVECVIFVYNMLSSMNCRLFLSCRCGINI